MNKLKIVLPLLICLSACAGGNSSTTPPPPPPPAPATAPAKMAIANTPGDLGIFDPSVASDPSTGRLWMSYSSVHSSPNYASNIYWAVSIRLAYSDDSGVNWQDAGLVSAATERADFGPMTLPAYTIPAGSSGIWQSETSSLVYDPSAPASERWKLVWHQYLHAANYSLFADYGWIAMKQAATPQALAAATTVKLFGGAGLQANNDSSAAPVFSPVVTQPVVQLNQVSQAASGQNAAEINLCIFAEPGLHASASKLYLGIYCADAATFASTGAITEYLVYFSCTSPCNMTDVNSWTYLGRLLTRAEASATGTAGDHHFQAPAFASKGSNTYLLATPVNTASSVERYNGCRLYKFSDVNSSQLVRNNGQLVEYARVDGTAGSHNGACAAYNGMDGGILYSQTGTFGTADAFAIYKSQVSLP